MSQETRFRIGNHESENLRGKQLKPINDEWGDSFPPTPEPDVVPRAGERTGRKTFEGLINCSIDQTIKPSPAVSWSVGCSRLVPRSCPVDPRTRRLDPCNREQGSARCPHPNKGRRTRINFVNDPALTYNLTSRIAFLGLFPTESGKIPPGGRPHVRTQFREGPSPRLLPAIA